MSRESSTRHCLQRVFALRSSFGFTAVELIIVMMVLSVLVVSIGFKMNTATGKANVAADQLIADIRYVQVRAMGMGTSQGITFTIGSDTYTAGGEQKNLPGNVAVTGTSFGNTLTFNSLGEPTFGTGSGTIDLSGGRTITIYGITGKTE
ncbi:MAG: hypothetical protein A4E64_00354 [Syntrophorhabdus sp. PtaU1.Bin058]|nr:MAG: hypothetical protein A4E64_00354 [Syntrophorhabdus sp. PtaU1.Bin058]